MKKPELGSGPVMLSANPRSILYSGALARGILSVYCNDIPIDCVTAVDEVNGVVLHNNEDGHEKVLKGRVRIRGLTPAYRIEQNERTLAQWHPSMSVLMKAIDAVDHVTGDMS